MHLPPTLYENRQQTELPSDILQRKPLFKAAQGHFTWFAPYRMANLTSHALPQHDGVSSTREDPTRMPYARNSPSANDAHMMAVPDEAPALRADRLGTASNPPELQTQSVAGVLGESGLKRSSVVRVTPTPDGRPEFAAPVGEIQRQIEKLHETALIGALFVFQC